MTERNVGAEVIKGLQEVREHRAGRRKLRETQVEATPLSALSPEMIARIRENLEDSQEDISVALPGLVARETPPEFEASGLENLRALMDSYTVHATGIKKPPTLMEIAGFPRRENVYSNILAFLLDSERVHGFGELFIRSIMAVYGRHCPAGWPGKGVAPESFRGTHKVEREATTDSRKSIDLLIECAEFVICIENKIRSPLHNDLREYRKHCEKISNGHRDRVLGIVLSPDRVSHPSLKAHRFVNITYGDLVDEVRHRMGSYISSHNTRYQYLLLDFLEQADRFSRINAMTDDQRKFLEFWRENCDKITNIRDRCDELWHLLRRNEIAQAHIDAVNDRLAEGEREVFKTWIYKHDVSVYDLAGDGDIDGCGLFLDVDFHPLRVKHVLGKRRGCEPDVLASRIGNKCGIKFVKDSDRNEHVIDQSPLDESVREEVVRVSVAILKQIAEMRLQS